MKHRWTYFLRTLQDIQDLLEPLENEISQMLMPAITERKCNQLDRNILALPVRLGGLGLGNPSLEARREYASSVKVTKPLVEQIVSQSHQLPEDSLTKLAQQEVRSERSKELEHRAERIKEMAPRKTQRALDLATEKGSSAWLTVLPLQDLGFNLNIRGSSVTLLNYATTCQWKISPPHVLVLAFTVKQKIKQSSGCEVRYPRAWFLGTTSISLLRCEGLSP